MVQTALLSRRLSRRSVFLISLIGALALVATSTTVAYLQRPPAPHIREHWWEWWYYPVEDGGIAALPAIQADLNSVCAGNGMVVAVGNTGLVVISDDWGATWRRIPFVKSDTQKVNNKLYDKPLTQDLVNVSCGGSHAGWIATTEGLIFRLPVNIGSELGKPEQSTSRPERIEIIADFGGQGYKILSISCSAEDGRCYFVGSDGFIYIAEGWTLREKLGPIAGAREIYALDVGGGALVTGSGGLLWKIQDGAVIPQTSPTTTDLHGVLITDQSEWVTGVGGQIYQRRIVAASDQLSPWSRHDSGTNSTLNAIYFEKSIREARAWAVGENGTVLLSYDKGIHWVPLTRGSAYIGSKVVPRLYFAPWYYLTWLIFSVPVAALMRRQRPESITQSVESVFASDSAIQSNDDDALAFSTVATGIAGFLRNVNTLPPLTIAITGEWGSGKSSIMNLIRVDLARFGVRPVWFNAWHHQKEEHLFAALIESIRVQAIPHLWTYPGLVFWFRLSWLRRKGLVLSLLFVALGSALVLGALNPLGNELSQTVASLVAMLGAAHAIYKKLDAFHIKPAQLLSAVSKNARLSDLQEQTSFRQQFSTDFHEVTRALGERAMTIFIDDLDRCRPDQVLDVLESVNFLLSSGECFVVLGIDRDRVEHSIGLSVKEVAAEMAGPASTGSSSTVNDMSAAQKEWVNRTTYARHYLDKLINVEIRVPAMTQAQVPGLIALRPKTGDPRTSRFHSVLITLGFVAALFLAFNVAYDTGLSLQRQVQVVSNELRARSSEGSTQTEAKPKASSSPSQIVQIAQNSPTHQARPKRAAEHTPEDHIEDSVISPLHPNQSGDILPGLEFAKRKLPSGFMSFVFLLLMAAIYVSYRAYTDPDVTTEDSPAFTKAISDWAAVIYDRNRTPRSIKRFMNRLRYLAMAEPAGSKREDWIPEQVLVAIAALRSVAPNWTERLERESAIHTDIEKDFQTDSMHRGLANSGLECSTLLKYKSRFDSLADAVRFE